MGVDYYNCSLCNEIFVDCGPNGFCGSCEGWMCGHCHREMTEKYGYVEEGSEIADNFGDDAAKSCDKCSGDVIDEREFRNYIISLTGKTEDELEEEFRKTKASGK